MAADTAATAKSAESTTSSAPVEATEAAAKRFGEASDKIRERNDRAAKAFAALGSAAVSAVGIKKFPDIFPLAPASGAPLRIALAGILVGYAAMAFAVAGIALRMWRSSDRVYTTADPARMRDLRTDDERRIVRQLYDEHALLNGASSLASYQAQGHRLQRLAEASTDPELKADLQARGTLIRAEVRAVQARAAMLVIRDRAAKAVTGGVTAVMLVLFTAGLCGVAVGADYLDSQRKADAAALNLVKECAAAQKELTAADSQTALPPRCSLTPKPAESSNAAPPTATGERARAVKSLSAQYDTCVAGAKENADAVCGEIGRLVKQLTAGLP